MLTVFSWGYWGWGSSTKQLVQAFDAAELARGFARPMFVDIRLRRNVRAKGFNGDAFEKIVGRDRYQWMPGLGNRSIATHADHIVIDKPEEANNLLELATSAYRRRQRVVFFCSCEDVNVRYCHRNVVAGLLLKAAKKSGRRLQVVEWPGEKPVKLAIDVPSATLEAVRKGRKSLPLSGKTALSEIAGLPWGSVVTICSGDERLSFGSGPAKYQRTWCLPVLDGSLEKLNLKLWAERFRKERGFEARYS